MTDEVTEIGKGLGRRVNHDPRSLSYKVEARGVVASAEWKRVIPILDQGALGSCTGHATAGVLGTEPFRKTVPNLAINDQLAITLYSAATQLDPWPGGYPPEDTGSDGNSVAKAARNAGYISGWQHITSMSAAYTAIQSGPFITGTNWYSSMFYPNAEGIVTISGSIEGGHEYEVVGYNAERGLWKFANSWSADWGKDGYFYMSDATYGRLLAEQGDATVFVPLTLPAPEPTPAPTPVPVVNEFPTAVVQTWIDGKHYTLRETRAANAIQAWLDKQ